MVALHFARERHAESSGNDGHDRDDSGEYRGACKPANAALRVGPPHQRPGTSLHTDWNLFAPPSFEALAKTNQLCTNPSTARAAMQVSVKAYLLLG